MPTIKGADSAKIHDFYEKLVSSVQSLETLGKIKEVNGYVRATLDKLETIRGDLVRTDDNWQDWEFQHLIEALRKWTERNPIKQIDRESEKKQMDRRRRGRNYQTKNEEWKPRPCVYCKNDQHKSVNCDKVTTTAERKKQLSIKQLCFNCTGVKHRAADCRSKTVCQSCKKKHHNSICDNTPLEMLRTAAGKGSVIHPVVIVNAGGIKCCALLDSGAGSSYASAALLDRLKNRPIRKEPRRIEMMMHTVNKMTEVHNLEISNLKGDFHLKKLPKSTVQFC